MEKYKCMIFIVGASRSGTTMLNRILGQHPSITAMNELHYFGDLFEISGNEDLLPREKWEKPASKLFSRYRRGLWDDKPNDTDIRDANELLLNDLPQDLSGSMLFYHFIKFIAEENGTTHVAEQTPRNIYYSKNLLSNYPDARIIHIIRDPRAVIASQKNRWTRRSALHAKNIPFMEMIRELVSYHPYSMCLLWKKAYSTGRNVEDDKNYIRIKFEDLVQHPEVNVRKICNFLKIEYHNKMLEIPQIDSSIRTKDNSSLGIKKNSLSSWKKVLTTGEIMVIEHLLSTEMKHLGYKSESSKNFSSLISSLYIFIKFPLHIFGTFLANPQRFLIQLKGILLRNGQ